MTDQTPAPEAPAPAQQSPSTTPAPVAPVPSARAPRPDNARNRRIWIGVAIAGVVVLVAVALLGYGVVQRRMDASKKLDRAITLVEETDKTVVAVDKIIQSEITSDLAADATAVQADIAPATAGLEEAVTLIGEARKALPDADRERADLLEQSAQARIEMLAEAPAILVVNVKAAQAKPLADQAWERTLKADKLSKDAVASYNKLNEAGVQRSRQLNKDAEAEFVAARDLFSRAETSFPEAPLELYLAFLNTKITQVKLSQQSDAAWLRNDIAGANAIIAKYNAEDTKAIQQAKELPASPSEAIAEAYELAAGAATERYSAARDKATKADEAYRTW